MNLKPFLTLCPLVIAMIACYASGEFYPLSSFPMYSKFDDRTYLVYLKSPDGEALPTIRSLSMPSSQLKKRYGAELKELKSELKGSHFDWSKEQKQKAGEATLQYLNDTFSPGSFANRKLKGAQLIDVRIRRTNGKLVVTEEPIATIQ